jgi:hypothetical protein
MKSNDNEKYQGMTDHDLLVTLNVKNDVLEKQFSNHLRHHWYITSAAISAGLTGLVSLAVSLIMMFVKWKTIAQ